MWRKCVSLEVARKKNRGWVHSQKREMDVVGQYNEYKVRRQDKEWKEQDLVLLTKEARACVRSPTGTGTNRVKGLTVVQRNTT